MDLSEQLQMNIQVYANATDIFVRLLDKDNKETAHYGTPCSYCTVFREASGRHCPCDKSHARSCEQAENIGDAYISLCPAGLIHFSVAVIYNGTYQGSVLAGPITLDLPEMESVDEVIRQFGLSLDYRRKLYTALQNVPLIEPFQARHLSRLLYLLISNLTSGEKERREVLQTKAMQQAHIGEFIKLAKEDPDMSPSQFESEKKLINCVLSGDPVSAKKTLNDMLGQIYFTSGNNIDIIKVRTIELISALSHAMYEAGLDEKTVYKMVDDYMRALPEIHDIADLSYLLMETLELLTNMAFPKTGNNTGLIRKSIAYINEYYNQNPTLSEVASHINLNPSYFSALFKKETGTNFSSYLLNVKMENAKLLLRNSNLSLSDISAELGFESQSYFSKLFKKETGLTPRDYRHHI